MTIKEIEPRMKIIEYRQGTVDLNYADKCGDYETSRRKGHWLYKKVTDDYRVTGQCSECKQRKIIDHFCPNCGAEMVEPQESEE